MTARNRPGGLLAGLVLTAAASAIFYYRQNHAGQVGGPMSIEKILWLNYAITAWFVVPAVLVRHPDLVRPLRRILAAFLASMLARGAIELWMIYVTFGWSPLYGIAHNLFNIGLLAVLRRAARPGLAGLDPFNAGVRRFLITLQLTLVAESVFAGLFYRMSVHQEAVYFAAATPEFAHINLLTRWVDVAVYGDLALFLWRQRDHLFTGAPRLTRAEAR